MKTRYILIIMLSLPMSVVYGQTWDELFNQKQTQTRYLLEQIAALRVYAGHLQKTYRIAKDGLEFIGKATKGEFDLHDEFFHSLQNVNPAVSSNPKVSGILSLNQLIRSNYHKRRKVINSGKMLSKDEERYFGAVYARIFKDCDKILSDLKNVCTDGLLEMRDDERIRMINRLYEEIYSNYQVAETFGNGTMALANARVVAVAEKDHLKVLNNINR